MKALKTIQLSLFSITFIVFNLFLIQLVDTVTQIALGFWFVCILVFIVFYLDTERKRNVK
jgi:predicted membrane metal-binding protein